jgi:hypothetical protein
METRKSPPSSKSVKSVIGLVLVLAMAFSSFYSLSDENISQYEIIKEVYWQ